MMHKVITTNKAPGAVGPYSQAVVAEGARHIFVSGQIPLNPENMQIESSDVCFQTVQVLNNLSAILQAAGATLNDVVKVTIYIKNMDDFSAINAEYEKFFVSHKPARACIEVARLPKDALVEIDAIAVI